MGLTEIQKEMIRGIATNNMLKARQGALGALNEDTTQKNKNFVARYKSILTSEHGFLYELPAELKGLLQCEDVSMSFKESRYYVSEQQKELASKIFRMAEVSQKLMELQIPYKMRLCYTVLQEPERLCLQDILLSKKPFRFAT